MIVFLPYDKVDCANCGHERSAHEDRNVYDLLYVVPCRRCIKAGNYTDDAHLIACCNFQPKLNEDSMEDTNG